MSYRIPAKDGLASILTLMYGESIAVTEQPKAPEGTDYHGVFINAADEVVARVSCTLPSAAALGCALSMIPPGGAEGMVEDKELSASASANLYEVMNMLSSLFMDDRSSHLKLARLDTGAAPELQSGSGGVVFSADMGRYGQALLDFQV